MLIHLGDGEFIEADHCVMIINLETIDEATKTRIRKVLDPMFGDRLCTAVLTEKGRWLGSVISAHTLAQRGIKSPFIGAHYRKPRDRGRSRRPTAARR